MLPGQLFNRHRESTLLWVDSQVQFQNFVNNVPQSIELYTSAKKGEKKFISDYCVSNFTELKNSGAILMNAVSVVSQTRTLTPASLTIDIPEYGNVRRTCSGDVVCELESEVLLTRPLLRLTEQDRATLLRNALLEAYKKANEPVLMSGEFLSDLSGTLGMLRRPFASGQAMAHRLLQESTRRRRSRNPATIASALSRARVANQRSNLSNAQAVANSHLEAQMGWTPLIKDIFAVASIASQKLGNQRERRVARSGVMIPLLSATGIDDSRFWGNISSRVDMTLDYKASFNAGVVFDIVNQSKTQDLMGKLGLRARDLPSTVYEATPLSWVVDYFTNVGTWLQAMTPNPDIEIQGTWCTESIIQIKKTETGNVRWLSPSGVWKNNVGYAGASTVTDKRYARYVNQPLPPPEFRVTPLGTFQTANLLALSCQRIVSTLKAAMR